MREINSDLIMQIPLTGLKARMVTTTGGQADM
jgi:hypothetical protein